MLAIRGPTAAEPLLWLGLQKIARTPTGRLAVGYHLISRDGCPPPGAICAPPFVGAPLPPGPPVDVADFFADHPAHLFPHGVRPLGLGLYLDRLLAGGIVGEFLPLSRVCLAMPLANLWVEAREHAPLGGMIDVAV
jgi:hypothetical protein